MRKRREKSLSRERVQLERRERRNLEDDDPITNCGSRSGVAFLAGGVCLDILPQPESTTPSVISSLSTHGHDHGVGHGSKYLGNKFGVHLDWLMAPKCPDQDLVSHGRIMGRPDGGRPNSIHTGACSRDKGGS